jgi:hypothetical protein
MLKSLHIFAIAAVMLTLASAGLAAEAAGVFTLKSTTFEDGKMMPLRAASAITCRPNFPGSTYRTVPEVSSCSCSIPRVVRRPASFTG